MQALRKSLGRSAHAQALGVSLFAVGLCGCPAEVERVNPAAGAYGPQTSPDDPRVVQVDEDLYAKQAPSNPAPAGNVESPGTGISDETNGECRLFAPKFPNPACCGFETGFDAEAAARICGHEFYLGESARASCGYFFMPKGGGKAASFRATHVISTDARTAAEQEAVRLNFQMRRDDLKALPVPGVPGAFMIQDRTLRWAFLPGWPKVRQFAWTESSCSDEKIPELIKVMALAEPPLEGAKRPMVPAARPMGTKAEPAADK